MHTFFISRKELVTCRGMNYFTGRYSNYLPKVSLFKSGVLARKQGQEEVGGLNFYGTILNCEV